jgi:AcrR family transcriptional regulator
VPPRQSSIGLRERESETTRRTILEATEAILEARGEEALSIREVCARAGVTAPTIYHHFGDKAALIDRVVDACFAEFDRTLRARSAAQDPVEALRSGFDRYIEYGIAHPIHYRLMFSRRRSRPTPAALASYDGLRRRVAAIAAVGRLRAPVEDATAACWSAVHGVTSLLIAGFWQPGAPPARLVRDSMIAQLTRPAPFGRRQRPPVPRGTEGSA